VSLLSNDFQPISSYLYEDKIADVDLNKDCKFPNKFKKRIPIKFEIV